MGAAEPRPFASLSSGLLARKGQAKPAMRPQGFAGFGHMPMGHEDLGWNDMGYDAPAPATGETTPAPRAVDPSAFADAPPSPPAVHAHFEALEAEYGAGEPAADEQILQVKPRRATARVEAPTIAPVMPEPEPAVRHAGGRKAAFTLRLDSDRHLRLRLASAVGRRSAQQLVTEALDRFLDGLDDAAGRRGL